MNGFIDEVVIPLLAGILTALFCVGCLALFDKWSCESRWQRSGFEVSWGPIQGCLIKKDGKWIPDKNYRDLD